jgi:hypothetical protein
MRFLFSCFLLFSIASFSQDKLIELKIDTIITDNSNPKERKFTVNYHIKNLTQNPVTFILNTKSIISNSTGSLKYIPYYKLFEKNTPIDIPVFNNGINKKFYLNSFLNSRKDSTGKPIKNYLEKIQKKNNEILVNSITRIDANELKKYSVSLFWDKERYLKYNDSEYYLDEKQKHYFEISIHLMKEELKEKFTAEQFKNIIEDKTLIKGWFTSNKSEIDL